METEGRHSPGQVEVEDARLHPGHPLLGVDLQDAVHARGHHHDRVGASLAHGHRPPGQARARAPGHDGPAVGPGDGHGRLHLPRGHGEAHHAGATVKDRRIAPVEGQLQRFRADALGRQRTRQLGGHHVVGIVHRASLPRR